MPLSHFAKAALIMAIGVAGIPLGDTAGKFIFLHTSVEPWFVAWSRYAIGILLVWLAYGGRGFDFSVMKDWRLWLRSSFVTAAVVSILYSISTESLANAFSAFFIGPILAYFGAAFFLKEKITWFRTITLLIAFVGVLIVVRPGGGMSAGLIYALIGGCFYAAFLVSTRWLAHVAKPRMLLLSNLIMGTAIMTPLGISNIPQMDVEMVGLVIWSAGASAIGNLAIVLSSSMVDGSRIAPLIYLQVFYATLFAIFFFADFPDQWTWIGLTILVTSGFASFFAQKK